ncbi:MAG: hypothetical protein EZS28_053179 [Streblomastix strix]|uniref:USP domain-containing protein n=1 Tax=Streblomastix strix TaxID=222440 RepID=A0A5J4RJW2_9EUKA|nr:MAG: hypothetical protein EZS28_053179 [Streblomastix strix]
MPSTRAQKMKSVLLPSNQKKVEKNKKEEDSKQKSRDKDGIKENESGKITQGKPRNKLYSNYSDNNSFLYQLRSVIVHEGNHERGHYYCFARNWVYKEKEQEKQSNSKKLKTKKGRNKEKEKRRRKERDDEDDEYEDYNCVNFASDGLIGDDEDQKDGLESDEEDEDDENENIEKVEQWYLFNDNTVTKVNLSEVLNQQVEIYI